MKFSFKYMVAAATFIATSAASAASGHDWQVTSGTASITLSYESLLLLSSNETNFRVTPRIPTEFGLPNANELNTATFVKVLGQIDLRLSGGTTSGDSVTSFQAAKSVLNFRHGVFDNITGDFRLQSVFLTNFDFDLVTSTVYATAYTGIEYLPSQGYQQFTNVGKIAVFNVDPPTTTGGITLDNLDAEGQATGHASDSFSGQLKISSQAADLLWTALELASIEEHPATPLNQVNWGTARFDVKLSGTPAVPEPSHFALIGAGLLALCATKRFGRKP